MAHWEEIYEERGFMESCHSLILLAQYTSSEKIKEIQQESGLGKP